MPHTKVCGRMTKTQTQNKRKFVYMYTYLKIILSTQASTSVLHRIIFGDRYSGIATQHQLGIRGGQK